jgi:hypothetical protein
MRKSATGIDYAVASGMIVFVVMMILMMIMMVIVMMIMMIVMMIMMMIVLMMIMMVKNDDAYHHFVVVDEYNDGDTFIYYRKCSNRCLGLAIQARAQCWCW